MNYSNNNYKPTETEENAARDYAEKGAMLFTDLYIERYEAFLAGVAFKKNVKTMTAGKFINGIKKGIKEEGYKANELELNYLRWCPEDCYEIEFRTKDGEVVTIIVENN